MSLILPYEDQYLQGIGGFVTPKNVFLPNGRGRTHEEFAEFYCNEKLISVDRDLFIKWKKTNKYACADFLVLVLGYEKLETLREHCFVTSSPRPYSRFYNYILMDWIIDVLQRQNYNPISESFENGFDTHISSYKEQDVMSDIDEIRRSIPLKDRHLYFI